MAELFNKTNAGTITHADIFVDNNLPACKKSSKKTLMPEMMSISYSKDHFISLILLVSA